MPRMSRLRPTLPRLEPCMPSSSVLLSLALVTGLGLSAQGKWDPFFDYTTLPPSNETYWEPLGQAEVQMEKALEVAAEAEGATVRPLKAELRTGPEGPAWNLELFVGGDTSAPKRVNMQVSTKEPKVLKRLELLALADDEKEAWKVLAKSQVPAAIAIQLCKDKSAGEKVEPMIREPRLRKLQFIPEPDAPIWRCELMGDDWKKEQIRRYKFSVNAAKPMVKHKIMLDRFAGEPLRGGKHTELDNGMFLYDFTSGDGEVVTADSKVKVNYRLFLLDSTKLHDTWEHHRPETFVISKAPLKGMSEGMVGMRVGGKRKIAMPYELAFGESGNELAPPKAMIVCDVAIDALIDE